MLYDDDEDDDNNETDGCTLASTVTVLISSSNVVSFTTPGTGMTEFTIELHGREVNLGATLLVCEDV